MVSVIAKILIVDDEPKLLFDVLQSYGYDVAIACNGVQALEIISHKNFNFDLIILDINMPQMDGWQVLKTIRDELRNSTTPVLMLTGVDSRATEIVCLKLGADDYILKPFKLPSLLARIEALIRRSKIVESNSLESNNSSAASNSTLMTSLSAREREILRLVAEGINNNEIADLLSVQEVTVKAHLKSIFNKLNVSNRVQAAILALKLNII